MVSKKAEFLIDEIKYNGHIQSLGAASIVFISSIFLGVWDFLISIIVIYLIFQQIYTYDRYRDIKQDYLTNRARTAHLRSYRGYTPTVFMTLFVMSFLLLFFYSSYGGIILSSSILILGLLYPVYFKNITKYVYLFKNIYVASVFTLLVLYGNIFYSVGVIIDSFIVIFLLYVFLESMFTQFFLDIKDYKKDRASGLFTLSALLGKSKTIKVLNILSYVILVIFGFLWLFFNLSETFFMIIIGTFVFNQYTILKLKKENKNIYFISASKYILWTILVMIVNILI